MPLRVVKRWKRNVLAASAVVVITIGSGLAVVGRDWVGSNSGGGGSPGSGASSATCSPDPCTTPTGTSYNVSTTDGAGLTVTRSYKVWKPGHLTGEAPAIFVLSNLITSVNSGSVNWATIAATNKMIVVSMDPPRSAWVRGATGESNVGPGAGTYTCGSTGDQLCDDTPEIVSIYNAVIVGGANDQNIDPDRVYATGGSNPGQMTWELMCNPLSTKLFAGYGQVSALFQSVTSSTPTVCPAVDDDTNHAFSWAFAFGTNDSGLISTCDPPITGGNCEPGVTGGGTPHWYIGPHTGVDLWRDSSHQDCPDVTVTTSTSGDTGKMVEKQWTCAVDGTGAAEITITGGGHAFGGLQGYNNSNMEQALVDFWTSHWPGARS
jgi:poly(3-hydroxybutyrate) depolymerase